MSDLPTPGTAEYDASIPPEWQRPSMGFLSTIPTSNTPNKETTTMNNTAQLTVIRDIVVSSLEAADWSTSEINELITEVTNATDAGWKLVAEERTLHVTYTVTVEVEDVLVEDPDDIDVYDLDLYDFDDVISQGHRVVAADCESAEVA